MSLTTSEKIKVIVKRRNMTFSQLAKTIGISRQNLYNKLKRDSFQEQDLRAIAEALDCDFDAVFVMRDTGERV